MSLCGQYTDRKKSVCVYYSLTVMCVCVFTHRHVGGTASTAGLGLGVDKASADTKVTQFDLTLSVQQDVGGFDVPVDDAMLLLQVQQRLHYLQ